jgi:hypothetical protein
VKSSKKRLTSTDRREPNLHLIFESTSEGLDETELAQYIQGVLNDDSIDIDSKAAKIIDWRARHGEPSKYTRNALLYQDILRYYEVQTDRSFKFTELARWLLTRNKEFTEYYQDSRAHISMSNRIAYHRQRIQKCIDNLVSLYVIEKVGMTKAEKNQDIETPLYRFTEDGKFIFTLLRYYDLQESEALRSRKGVEYKRAREELSKKADELVQAIDAVLTIDSRAEPAMPWNDLQKYNSCWIYFARLIIDKMIERKVFLRFVHQLHTMLISGINQNELRGVFDIFLILSRYTSSAGAFLLPGKPSLEWEIWKESFGELDKTTQSLILQHYKLAFEYPHPRMPYYRPYELARFENRNYEDKVVLEISCTNNHLPVPHVMETLEAIKMHINRNWNLPIKCTKCGRDSSIDIMLFE